MNLVSFSLRTKGVGNFARRLWTVFTRFGFTEERTRQDLYATLQALRERGAAPTYFIPAVVLQRHPLLLADVARDGAEVGIHGYVHNDYRTLSREEQLAQTKHAMDAFREQAITASGFRNPYLGWTEESLDIFSRVGLDYDSNEAVLHDVIDEGMLSPTLADGFRKSRELFQAIEPSVYALRPHFEGRLLRLPTSIPDDEMLYDRLRITDPAEVGRIWSEILRQVYALGGLYVLNMHPERALLLHSALLRLLETAESQPLPVWLAPLRDIATWWAVRREVTIEITQASQGRWRVQAQGSPRATLLARHVTITGARAIPWFGADLRVDAASFEVAAQRCPMLAVSPATPEAVTALLAEQGYPFTRVMSEGAGEYAMYIDMPEGLGETREQRMQAASQLVERIKRLDMPLVRLNPWPDGARAALAITGDIDSVTIQDFFRRILEVRR